MSVFVHAQGIKTVHAWGWVEKWQNSVHVVVECPPYVVLGACQMYINTGEKIVQLNLNISCQIFM